MTTITERFGVNPPTVRAYPKAAEGCVYPELVIGLELETEKCDNHVCTASSVRPFQIDVKTDNSLRGSAYEFITRPMRTDHALAALTDFFGVTKFTEANYSDRCSVHVHVNCTDMHTEQLSSLALLYTVVEEILFEFVGSHRETNIYCIPWNQCRSHYNLVKSFLDDGNGVLRNWVKYTALNLLPLAALGTVEFRQMHGTADMVKLTKWVNMIGGLFKVAKTRPLKDLMAEIKELNTTSQYEVFFNSLLGGQLAYTDKYREAMEQGVILAKFSLVGMEKQPRYGAKKTVPGPIQTSEFTWGPAQVVRRPTMGDLINAAAEFAPARVNRVRPGDAPTAAMNGALGGRMTYPEAVANLIRQQQNGVLLANTNEEDAI
jgi:hypothetical protein